MRPRGGFLPLCDALLGDKFLAAPGWLLLATRRASILVGAPLPAYGLAHIGGHPLALQRPLEGPRPSPHQLRRPSICKRKAAARGTSHSATQLPDELV